MSDRYYSAEVTEAISKERDELRAERDKLRDALQECDTIRSLPHAYHGDSTISQDVRSEKISSVLREIADAPTLTTNNRQRLRQIAENLSQNVLSEQQVSTSRADAISRPNSRVRETDFGNTDDAISDEYDEVINETTKAAIDAADRGEVEELSDVERQEMGLPASRAMLVYLLREAYELAKESDSCDRAMLHHIRDVLSREES